jgi:signal transduction histidine kinase
VTDTGIGIPHAYQSRVFDKFFRVPGASGGAAGLGLSIVKEIVEEHDGEIGLDSEEGEGSTFWFTLPCTTTHTVEEAVQL